jgi:hypothetical protein
LFQTTDACSVCSTACDGIAWADRPLTDYRLHEGNVAGVDQVGAAATLRGLGAGAIALRRAKALKLERLVQTLRANPGRFRPERLAAVQAAAAHWHLRAQLPPWGKGRLGSVMAELRRGGYHRAAAGWHSALRDLLGPGG